jgi:hypothetical protein
MSQSILHGLKVGGQLKYASGSNAQLANRAALAVTGLSFKPVFVSWRSNSSYVNQMDMGVVCAYLNASGNPAAFCVHGKLYESTTYIANITPAFADGGFTLPAAALSDIYFRAGTWQAWGY